MILLLFIAFLLLILSAFFSASEIAFISANKLGVEVIKNKKDTKGNIISSFYDRPKEFLSAILVANNIVLVLFTMVCVELLKPLLGPHFGSADGFLHSLISTVIITFFILVLGEFLPKTIARLFANEMLLKMALPMRFSIWLLKIPTWVLMTMSKIFIKHILKEPQQLEETNLSRVDLEDFINDQVSEKENFDKEILTNALNLGQRKVRDAMIPRTEIVYIEKTATIDELTEAFKRHKLSRIIVVQEDIENIVGYVHHQQMFHSPKRLDKIVMPILFMPDAMGLQELMHTFIRERSNIAAVVDEFGSIAGIITLEDILEEIFGEIADEHDIEDLVEEDLGDHTYLFAGRLETDYLNEKYPFLEIPEGEYQTLAGYIIATLETIPEKGEEIDIKSNKFTIESVADNKIELIKVKNYHQGDNKEPIN